MLLFVAGAVFGEFGLCHEPWERAVRMLCASGCAIDHIAQQHRYDFVPEATLKI